MAELEVSLADGEYYYDVDPCPFCGKDLGEFDTEKHGNMMYYWVWCGNCSARGPNDLSYKRAAKMWNMRR